jgi:KpsF/GutQ family protein
MGNNFEDIKTALKKESDAIIDAMESLDETSVLKLLDKIIACEGKLVFSGCGTSGAAGKKMAHTFSCVNQPALFLEPSDAVHGGLGVVNEKDIVILLSKGGSTDEINHLISPTKVKKAFIVGVTENSESVLARGSDLFLKVKVKQEADKFDMLATSSILGLIAVFDAIAIKISELTGFTKEKFSIIHPGGAVGERLLNKKLYD